MKDNTVENLVRTPMQAGLLILIVLQVLMLAALYTKTPPHPPLATPVFALAPFLSASITLAVAAYGMKANRYGLFVAGAACVTALVSYGPQKYIDAAFGSIWPAVVLAQLAILTVAFQIYRHIRGEGVEQ